MRRMSEWLYRRVTWRWAVATSAAFAFFLVGPLRWQSASTEKYAGEEGAPDTRLWYSPDFIHECAERFGPEGRRQYIVSRGTFDVVWPIVYASCLSSLLTVTLRDQVPAGSRRALVNALPWVGFAFDMAENATVSAVMARHPERTPVVEQVAPVFTAAKWIAVGASTTLVAVLPALVGGRAALDRFAQRRS